MKDGIIRVAMANPNIMLGRPQENAELFADIAKRAVAEGARLVLFPELSLTGATAGELYLHKPIIRAAESAVFAFAEKTRELNGLFVIGAPLFIEGSLYNCAVAINRGLILGVIPAASASGVFSKASEASSEILLNSEPVPFGRDIIFTASAAPGLSVSVAVGEGASTVPANICLNPCASYETVGKEEMTETLIKAESYKNACAVVYANAGAGESGTDFVFSGRAMAYQCGKRLCKSRAFSGEELCFAEVDLEICEYERARLGLGMAYSYAVDFDLDIEETEIKKPYAKSPFVPECEALLNERCALILNMQARALAKRIERSYSRTAVLGVSGGLDSTLALMVAIEAADILGWDRKRIIAVTMPCFGTSKRTKSNAEKLSESLGLTFRTVDIKAAVNQHFSDIGHNPEKMDVVYENAQARERTQVLMDIANAEGGLVIGTGDLSELALGFATYNGDHMSMFGVNGSVPKTLMRAMVAYIASVYEREGNTAVSEALLDIVNTPVSPELLPADTNGEIAQCTEDIVGPYELHDYFIYYTVRYGFSPKKILRIAEASFKGVYDRATVKGWLKIFIKRFFASQFKRSCLPDGVKVGSVSLSPRGDFAMPSDMSAALWLKELDED